MSEQQLVDLENGIPVLRDAYKQALITFIQLKQTRSRKEALVFANDRFDHLDDLFGNLPAAGTGLRRLLLGIDGAVRQTPRRQEHNPATSFAALRTAGIERVALQSSQARSQAHVYPSR
jgi:hypothetical protein